MAKSNFLVFAESVDDKNIQTDTEYNADTQRVNGVVPGIAVPAMHNKLYKQSTIMAAALAQVIVQAGFDALDSDYTGLVANLRHAFCGSVNGLKPDAEGNIDITTIFKPIIELFTPKVGDVKITLDPTNPGTIFTGTTWELLQEGTFLMAAGNTYKPGSTGGSNTHKNTVDEMPVHYHLGTVGYNGNHIHVGTATSAGSHQHGAVIGTAGNHQHNMWGDAYPGQGANDGGAHLNDTNWGGHGGERFNTSWAGAHNHTISIGSAGAHTHALDITSAGNHNHTLSIQAAGNSKAWDIRPQYKAFYIWVRTA